jgi:hypothetical protein
MVQAVQVFWSPAGANVPSLGARALVDVTDGDTPNLRMPVRMLSVDTPEVTARTEERASAIDQEFLQLVEWIREGLAPIEAPLAEFVLPKLETGRAGSRHFQQGQAASTFGKQNIETWLTRPDGKRRNISSALPIARLTATTDCWLTSRATTRPRNVGRSLGQTPHVQSRPGH